jgi:hypothetical protein
MESKIWLYSKEQFALVWQARQDQSEIDLFGQKYVVTSCLWDAVRGGYYTVRPLIPIHFADAPDAAEHEWRGPDHGGETTTPERAPE